MSLALIVNSFLFKFIFSWLSSIIVSVRGYSKKSLNLSGALTAVVVGFALTLAGYCFFSSLLAFFITSSLLTKWKSEKKKKLEEDFKEGGQRNWLQVLCNGGFPMIVSIIYLMEVGYKDRPVNYARDFTPSCLSMAILGAIACCNGDTWSSEVGTAMGSKTPRLITTLKRVPIGTNGAVSFVGTAASLVGGLFIGSVYYTVLCLLGFIDSFSTDYPAQWPVIPLAAVAGLIGSFIDSVLGATLQYSGFCYEQKKVVSKPSTTVKHVSGRNILNNHLVNLLSSSLSGVIVSYVGYLTWQFID